MWLYSLLFLFSVFLFSGALVGGLSVYIMSISHIITEALRATILMHRIGCMQFLPFMQVC